jgi:hypothetical protein
LTPTEWRIAAYDCSIYGEFDAADPGRIGRHGLHRDVIAMPKLAAVRRRLNDDGGLAAGHDTAGRADHPQHQKDRQNECAKVRIHGVPLEKQKSPTPIIDENIGDLL